MKKNATDAKDELRHQFAESLRALMSSRRISGKEISLSTGVRESSIAEYRNSDKLRKNKQGEYSYAGQLPDAFNLWKLAEFFDVSIDSLFGRDREKSDNMTSLAKQLGLSGSAVKTLIDLKPLSEPMKNGGDLAALSSMISDQTFIFTVCRGAAEIQEQWQQLCKLRREILQKQLEGEEIPYFEILHPDEDNALSYKRFCVIQAFVSWLDEYSGYNKAVKYRRDLSETAKTKEGGKQ